MTAITDAPQDVEQLNAVALTQPLRMLISCPDKPGIVAAVSRFLFEAGANIVASSLF